MTLENFTNIAQTTLSADLSGTADTTMSVTSDADFPQSPQFRIKVVDEIMLVTSLPVSNKFIVTRGIESTTPATYLSGIDVSHVLTAGSLSRASRGDMMYATDTGSANVYATTLQPALTEYSEGLVIHLRPGTNNTGSSTLNIDALGAVSIKKNFSLDLEADDLVTDEIAVLVYDSTNFQLVHPETRIAIQEEGTAVTSRALTLNFVGANIEAIDTGSGSLINIYAPPPSFSSHFNTSDGTSGSTTPPDVSQVTRFVSDPTSDGTPFSRGAFSAGGSSSNVVNNTLSGILSYDTVNTFSVFDNTTTTFTVSVLDSSDSTILVSHVVNESGLGDSGGVVNGNYDEWKQFDHGDGTSRNAVRIQLANWGAEFFKFTVDALVTVDLTAIVPVGGRASVEIQHINASDGTYTFTSDRMFYDHNPTGGEAAVLSGVTIAEGTAVTTYLTGVQYYTTNSIFDISIADIDWLNAISYPSTKVNIQGTEYGLPAINLSGTADITGWDNAWDDVNSSYGNTAWLINNTNFYALTTTGNVRARTQDWAAGSWINSSNANVAISTFTDNSTRIVEDFRNEDKRFETDLTTLWISTNDLTTYTGDTDGLQIANSRLVFPTVDYSIYAPDATSQPNYSSLIGDRTYHRAFYHDSTSHSNMIVRFTDTNLVEQSITDGDFKIEWSIDGTAWFDGVTNYPGGTISDGDGNRIDVGNYDLDGGTKEMRFTFGTGKNTDSTTGDSTNGWGVWTRMTLQDDAGGRAVYIGQMEFTDWV